MRYTVIPKNPSCASPVVEADGYTWGVERVEFWLANEVVVTCEPPAPDTVIAVVNGVPLLGKDQDISSLRQTVAEFAVDWVAGVETAKAD